MNTNPNISIYPLPILSDNYVWLIINEPGKTAIAVDPGDATPVQDYLERHKLTLASILITHYHWDHYNGVAALKQTYNMPVYGNKQEKTPEITHPVNDKDEIFLPLADITLSFSVLGIPGHTLDHIAYYMPGALFCGDTLFSAGCGRLFEGTAEMMYQSLTKIARLPNNTKIYCAHEYTLKNLLFAHTVEPDNEYVARYLLQIQQLRNKGLPTLPSELSLEKAINPFLRCTQPELIKAVITHANKSLMPGKEIFTYIRQWKDNF